jgi:hypothetical protein
MRRFYPSDKATVNGGKPPEGFLFVEGLEAIAIMEAAHEALKVAKQTISIWHGDIALKEYQASPEMKCITETMQKLRDAIDTGWSS